VNNDKLKSILAQLDEALTYRKPWTLDEINREQTAACLAKRTDITVTFTNEEPETCAECC
jgi:hypothetical protein